MREFTKLGDIVKWPPKCDKLKANPYSKLWCVFHGDYRHRAYNCVALRKEIHFFIKKGYLTEFMSGSKSPAVGRDRTPTRRKRTPLRQPPPPPHHKVINFIVGGSELYGETYSQSKRVARNREVRVAKVDMSNDALPTVKFDETDRVHVTEPQHDSLVI